MTTVTVTRFSKTSYKAEWCIKGRTFKVCASSFDELFLKFAIMAGLLDEGGAECWRPIPGFSYQVSNQGRVRRTTTASGTHAGKILKPLPTGNGYIKVVLCRNGKRQSCLIHRLVAFAFLPSPLAEAHHKDAVKTHNSVDNLEWVTKKQNQREMVNIGHAGRGGKSKLTQEQVVQIRKLLAQGAKQKEIALPFTTCASNVSHISCKRNWKAA